MLKISVVCAHGVRSVLLHKAQDVIKNVGGVLVHTPDQFDFPEPTRFGVAP